MCNKTLTILNKIQTNEESGMSKDTKDVFMAIAEDMSDMKENQKKTEQMVVSIGKTQTQILEMVNCINNKLAEDKIEEKAYFADKITTTAHNWKFWVGVIGISLLAGMGVLQLLDRSTQVSEVVKAIK